MHAPYESGPQYIRSRLRKRNQKKKKKKENAERKVTPRVVRKEKRHRRTQTEETKGKSN